MSDDGRGVSRGGLSGLLAFLFTGGGLLPGLQESLTSSAALSGTSAPGFDVINYIDPLIGTTNGGHVFPGASIPYGMAKAVADTDSSGENAAGFVSDNAEIIGFSHMHDSGKSR